MCVSLGLDRKILLTEDRALEILNGGDVLDHASRSG